MLTTPPISILIGDPDPGFRARLRAAEGFAVVGETADAASTVALAAETRPDVCLIDAGLPGNALGAVAAIARRSPGTTIVVLAETVDSAGLVAALRRGASGYLEKGLSGDELAKTLRAARAGEAALSRAVVPALIDQVRRRPERRLATPAGRVELSVREWDVAELLRSGLGTGEIAGRLGLSPVTVRRHVGSVVKKLGAPDRRAAVRVLNHLQP